jgi:hypothetical protein
VAIGWALCFITIFAVDFGAYKFFQQNYVYDALEVALYGGLHRTAWALAVAWIIFACNTGSGGMGILKKSLLIFFKIEFKLKNI